MEVPLPGCWFQRHYRCWVLFSVCLGSMAMGLPYFSYGALLPYLSSLFYYKTGQVTSSAAMSLQPVMLELGITLTGSLSGYLEQYINVRLLNLVLVLLYVTLVAVSYFIDSYFYLTVSMFFVGALSGQINVCNVARLAEWSPRKSGTSNGVMGFFMGISGFVGSVLCTAIINPSNQQPVEVTDGNNTEMLFLDETLVQHTQYIWPVWAVIIAGLYIPGLFILRTPKSEEMMSSRIEDKEEEEEEDVSPLILPNKIVDYGTKGVNTVISPEMDTSSDIEYAESDSTLDSSDYTSVETLQSKTAKTSPSSTRVRPNYSMKETLKQPKFYVLSIAILTLSLTLLTATEMYKIIAFEAIKDDRFLNMTGALGSFFNALGMLSWGMILDRIGTRYTFTISFVVMGPLTVSLHYSKWCRYGYLTNLCVVLFCTGIFTCIAPACQELFGRRNLSLKYAAVLSAQGLGCLVFFLLQLGQKHFYGELAFLAMMGIPAVIAGMLAFVTFI